MIRLFNIWRPYKWFKPRKDGRYLCTIQNGYLTNEPRVVLLYFRERDSKWFNAARQNVFDGYQVYECCRAPMDYNRIFTDSECERTDVIAWKKLPRFYGWWKRRGEK